MGLRCPSSIPHPNHSGHNAKARTCFRAPSPSNLRNFHHRYHIDNKLEFPGIKTNTTASYMSYFSQASNSSASLCCSFPLCSNTSITSCKLPLVFPIFVHVDGAVGDCVPELRTNNLNILTDPQGSRAGKSGQGV